MKNRDYKVLEQYLFEANKRLSDCKKEQQQLKSLLGAVEAELKIAKYGSREAWLNSEENKIGVYEFHNLVDDIYYIGSSINVEHRFEEHVNSLPSDAFHQDIQRLGMKNFSFKILEFCTNREEAFSRELDYIHDYQRQGLNLYNKAGLLKLDYV